MSILRTRKTNRVLVIGLDGVPESLLRRLAGDGTMPRVAELLTRGHLSPMTVSLPEISAVSWPSFMTGTNPGTHGIFGFVDFRPGTYDIRFPQYRDLKARTIWDRLGDRHRRSVVVNQPSTYRARPLLGAMISGFVALDLESSVFPPSLLGPIQRLDYRIDVDTHRARADHQYLVRELDSMLEGRERAVDHLWRTEDWDYFEVVVTGTDRLYHFLWDALDDSSHPFHQGFRDYHRKVDAFVGRLVDRFTADCGREDPLSGLFLLSDHGFTGIVQEVQINVWLRENGYLSYRTREPTGLDSVTDDTRAFALDPGRIYIHRQGRFPRGRVGPEGAEELKREIAARLMELTHEGRPVMRAVHPVEEVYSGPHAKDGPDLLLLSHHGYDLKAKVPEKSLFCRTPLVGMHTWDDAFFFSDTKCDGTLDIVDLAARIEPRVGRG